MATRKTKKSETDTASTCRPPQGTIIAIGGHEDKAPRPGADPEAELEAALLQVIAGFYKEPALAEQLKHCRMVQREYSGCGFFAMFAVPAGSPLIRKRKDAFRFRTGNNIEAPELSHEAGSVLFIRDGLLDFWEVFAYIVGAAAALGSFTLLPMDPTAGME